jgi:hypothetical protein
LRALEELCVCGGILDKVAGEILVRCCRLGLPRDPFTQIPRAAT